MLQKEGIWCTSRFNAGSRIIENNLRRTFFLFLAPAEGSNSEGPYSDPFSNPAGQSLPLLNLTCPKISINLNIFNNPWKQHFTRKCTRSERINKKLKTTMNNKRKSSFAVTFFALFECFHLFLFQTTETPPLPYFIETKKVVFFPFF